LSSSGAIIRQGPHHGAQKSTTTGKGDDAMSASNVAASATSSGSAGDVSCVRQAPHRVLDPRVAWRSRLVFPQAGHAVKTPLRSSFVADMETVMLI
jgi:hypothetical protein